VLRIKKTKTFYPEINKVFRCASGPEPFTKALLRELEPVMQFLSSSMPLTGESTIKWILMELASNAVSASTGYLLGKMTGLSRNEMLQAIGTSVVWPDLTRRNKSAASAESTELIEEALGLTIPQWLSMGLRERILRLGLSPEKNWVKIVVNCNTEHYHFNIQVRSEYPSLKEDADEVRCRFESAAAISERILKEHKPFEDEDGIYHMPSFTGGGGMGLLECIRLSENSSLYLNYEIQRDPESRINFTLGNHPAG
jgi:hypothetical protein